MTFKEFSLDIYQLYKGKIENKIVKALLAAGSACIFAAVAPNYLLPIIIEVSNQYLNTHFDVPTLNLDYIVLGALISIGILFYSCAIFFYFKTNKKINFGTLLQIRHSSIESSNTSKKNRNQSNYKIETIDIDQNLEMSNTSKQGIENALYIQEKAANKILQSTNGNDSISVEYYGLAHIPLVILLGYQISDKIPVKFYEWNQNQGQWESIDSNHKNYPPLILEKNDEKQPLNAASEIVVKIGLTYPIPNENLKGLNLLHLNSYYLHLESPHRNNIINIEQLQKYKAEFRNLLDVINQKYTNLKKVHLFYSGQTSFAYSIGSAVTPRMDKEIIIYNYVGSESPQYNWNLNLKKISQQITVELTKEYEKNNV